ncbi:MAG TPA: hypothetical protein VGG49_01500 [Steroidobacteraceae bacterium]
MSLARRIAVIVLSTVVITGAAAALWIQYASPGESWANHIRLALFVIDLSSLILLSRLGLPVFQLLSPNWRRIVVGVFVMLAILPWTLVVSLAVRYGLIPNNIVGGLVLLIPFAIFLVTGLYMVVRGTFGRS